MREQLGLFPDASPPAPPPIDGLRFVEEAIDPELEAELTARVDATPLAPFEFGQWEGKRLTTSYGSDFKRARAVPAPPMPEWLASLRRVLAPRFDRNPDEFSQA